MRGTGKSAVGRTIAEQTGFDFVDIDKVIEEEVGSPIPEIVAVHGWDYFRDMESSVTAKVAQRTRVVISTGGGVILRPENVAALKASGAIVLLTAPLAHLQARVARSDRPSLSGLSPADELAKIWQEREALYRAAADATVHFDFHTDDKKADLAKKAEMVMEAVQKFSSPL